MYTAHSENLSTGELLRAEGISVPLSSTISSVKWREVPFGSLNWIDTGVIFLEKEILFWAVLFLGGRVHDLGSPWVTGRVQKVPQASLGTGSGAGRREPEPGMTDRKTGV